jgi:hypothetical protein
MRRIGQQFHMIEDCSSLHIIITPHCFSAALSFLFFSEGRFLIKLRFLFSLPLNTNHPHVPTNILILT